MDYCEECKYYILYCNWCDKWKYKINNLEVHNCYEKYDTPIYDMMVGAERKENDWKQDNRKIQEWQL